MCMHVLGPCFGRFSRGRFGQVVFGAALPIPGPSKPLSLVGSVLATHATEREADGWGRWRVAARIQPCRQGG